ncbi:DUF6777 domain-containing protein [Streptomyces catenulae]|uniref:DUF6777 domain-containing protein n=1 Tax=Streptomyces catenulae TaxID=66875 RepID=A0ABV2YYN7_9ACTN|nr:DUF6777 domain-containing protein [Streptomyces catenulae]
MTTTPPPPEHGPPDPDDARGAGEPTGHAPAGHPPQGYPAATGRPVRPTGPAPWWRRTARLALPAGILAAGLLLTGFLTRPYQGAPAAAEARTGLLPLPLQDPGPDPFTASVAHRTGPPSPHAAPRRPQTVRDLPGSLHGLYGGRRTTASCDTGQLIRYLSADRARTAAFADTEGIEDSSVPQAVRALTPVELRYDTRITAHGFRDGEATDYQAVMQAGTAVLVDGHGVPRVRCAGGTPLTPPIELKKTPPAGGRAWPGYDPERTIAVRQTSAEVTDFVLVDPTTGRQFVRPAGTTGNADRTAP